MLIRDQHPGKLWDKQKSQSPKLHSRRGQFYLKQKLWSLTANYKETDTTLGFLWLAFWTIHHLWKLLWNIFDFMCKQLIHPRVFHFYAFSVLFEWGFCVLPMKFDLSSRLILILICPRGDLRQKNSIKIQGCFSKMWAGRGGRPRGLFFTRIILQLFHGRFHGCNFPIIFTGGH